MSQSEQRQKNKQKIDGFSTPNYNKLVKDHPEYRSEFTYALNYINYKFGDNLPNAKKEVETWLNKKMKHIPDYEFMGIGQIAFLLNKGVYIADDVRERFTQRLNKLRDKYSPLDIDNPDINKPDTIRKRTGELIAELDGIIDDVLLNKAFLEPSMVIEKFGKVDYYAVQYHFQKMESGLEEIENENDRKVISLVVSNILEEVSNKLHTPTEQKKIVKRKQKEKKIIPERIVRKMKYLPEAVDLALKSVKPEKIIGAEVLWVFNVKTRKLGKYVAKDTSGLMVSGSTITNYNEEESVSKTIRKPKEVLTLLETSGKVSQRKLLDGIKATDTKLNGRINADTILVKVF
jgi:hypothetical protein